LLDNNQMPMQGEESSQGPDDEMIEVAGAQPKCAKNAKARG
jgi:hypothetical protein